MSSGQHGPASADRRLILVTSIGRSGTSLLTSILGRLGVRIPQPEVLADETNPRGFGEPRWAVDFHQKMLTSSKVTLWDSRPEAFTRLSGRAAGQEVVDELKAWLSVQFVGADEVVVKDPRIAWFLPLWEQAAREVGVSTGYVSMLRHPAEAVKSAITWYGDWQSDASRTAGWVNVTLEAERATRGAPRVFIRYQDLLQDWQSEIARLGDALDLATVRHLDADTRAQVDEFVDPSLYRSKVSWSDLAVPAPVEDLAERVWSQTCALAGATGDDEAGRAALDESHAAYLTMYAEAEALAQSSIRAAAKARPRRKPAPKASTGSGRPGAKATPAPRQQSSGQSVLRHVARRLPSPWRRRARAVLGRARG